MAARPPVQNKLGDTLALAMVAAAHSPLLLLNSDLEIVAASKSFGKAFKIDPDRSAGKKLSDLGSGEWDSPQLKSLLGVIAFGGDRIEAYEMDFQVRGQPPRSLILNACKLEYGDDADVRLLLSITDVTELKASDKLKDDLLRQKAVLMQELQHRVANSLQIIASVLMQSARKVQSDESRVHLTAAHSRVMAVGDVQRQLAASELGAVELAPYLLRLCESLGASMIHDPDQLSIEVQAAAARVDADTSISIGLIVTELVINALKHAFPDGRKGRIKVVYTVQGRNWTLAVSDNGIGMPKGEAATPGLGSSIVQALADQLKAVIQVVDAKPGTSVSVAHLQASGVDDGASERPDGRAV